MAKKTRKSSKDGSSATLLASVAAGGIGLILGLFVLGRKRDGDAGRAGAADRALGLPSTAAGDGGSTTPDLGRDQPDPGPRDRAPEDFRPDPTAPISADKRDAFAPATMPNPANPNAAQPAM